MIPDEELLRQYADARDDAAFAELVRRRIDFVYAVALRQVGGDSHLAQDAVQEVFCFLARKARSAASSPAFVSWLYTATRFAAAKVRRRQSRWLNRDQKAITMNSILTQGADPDWKTIRPVLDEAMHELGEQDRAAILLRYFEGHTLKDVGAKLGLAENSTRMRVERALDKLRARLAKRGIVSTAAALASTLAAQPTVTAPAGLASSAAIDALAATSAAQAVTAGTLFFAMNKIAVVSVGAVLAASLAANAVLGGFYFIRTPNAAPVARGTASQKGSDSAIELEKAPKTVAPLPGVAPAAIGSMSIDQLRAAGFPANVLRSIVRARLDEKYADRIRALYEAPDPLPEYWKLTANYWAFVSDPGHWQATETLKKEMDDDYRAALGPDAVAPVTADERAAYARKYGDLPVEKVARLEAVEAETAWERRLVDGFANGYDSTLMPMVGKEADAASVTRNYEASIAALLTPAELAEYKLRAGPIPDAVRQSLELFDPTESEFRAIVGAEIAFDQQYGDRDLYTGITEAESRARSGHQPELNAQIESLLNPIRAPEYRASQLNGPAFPWLLTRLDIPLSVGREVAVIQQGIQQRASALRADRSISVGARDEELSALAEEANSKVGNKLPGRALDLYKSGPGYWLQSIAPKPRSIP